MREGEKGRKKLHINNKSEKKLERGEKKRTLKNKRRIYKYISKICYQFFSFHFILFRSVLEENARLCESFISTFRFWYTYNYNGNSNKSAQNANNCKSPCDTFQSVECTTLLFRTVTNFIGKASQFAVCICLKMGAHLTVTFFFHSFSLSLSLVIHTFFLTERKTNRLKIYHICGIINVSWAHPAKIVFSEPHVISVLFEHKHTHRTISFHRQFSYYIILIRI